MMSAAPKAKTPTVSPALAAPAVHKPVASQASTKSSHPVHSGSAPAIAIQASTFVEARSAAQELQQDLASLHKLEKLNDPMAAKKMAQVMAKMKALAQATPQAEVEPGRLLGMLGKCYLGCGHDVHVLDFDQTITRHFKTSEGLPAGFETVRELAARPPEGIIGYMVYEKKILAMTASGETREL